MPVALVPNPVAMPSASITGAGVNHDAFEFPFSLDSTGALLTNWLFVLLPVNCAPGSCQTERLLLRPSPILQALLAASIPTCTQRDGLGSLHVVLKTNRRARSKLACPQRSRGEF